MDILKHLVHDYPVLAPVIVLLVTGLVGWFEFYIVGNRKTARHTWYYGAFIAVGMIAVYCVKRFMK